MEKLLHAYIISGPETATVRKAREMAAGALCESAGTKPCGTCRQILNEFAPNIELLCVRGDGRYVSYTLGDLLPAAFGKDVLG